MGIITGEFAPMPGGVGDFSRILAERVRERGHEVTLLCRHGARGDGLTIDTVCGWGLSCVGPIRDWARSRRLDIVNLQFQTAAFDMSPIPHFLPALVNVPLVVTFHDLRHPYLFPKAGRVRDWIVMRLARSASGVIVTNHEDDRRLRHIRRRMIPIGSNIPRVSLDAGARESYRGRAGAGAETLLLGYFGFVEAQKGVHHFLEALLALREAGHDVHLVFIGARGKSKPGGADTDYLRELERWIADAGLAEALHHTGALPDSEVARWLDATDVVVLPYTDGVSFRRGSLMAAINQGCAIVTTEPVIEIPEFAHGENLYLVERGSVPAIESALLQLLGDPEARCQLRRGARELRQRFDWDEIARETMAYCETIVQRSA